MSKKKKLVSLTGIHKIFNFNGTEIILKDSSYVDSIIFITCDETDQATVPSYTIGSHYIYAQGKLYNCNNDNTTDILRRLAEAESGIISLQADDMEHEGEISTLQSSLSTTQSEVSTLQSTVGSKQDTLVSGQGILIQGNVISSTVSEYDDTDVRSLINSNTISISNVSDKANANESAISNLNGTGVGSVTDKVNKGISILNGDANVATVSNGIVTIKGNIIETQGVISNGSASDIVLSKVSSTGDANDLSVNYSGSNSTVQNTVTDINNRLNQLENTQHVSNVVCEPVAYQIPSGAIYYDGTTRITGTMSANNGTVGTIYLVRDFDGTDTFYNQYIVKTSGSTKSWQLLGSTKTSLTGFIKNLSINGKTFTGDANNSVTTPDYIDTVSGENIKGWNDDFSNITVLSDIKESTTGKHSITLGCEIKTVDDVSLASSVNDGFVLATALKQYVEEECLSEFRVYDD